MLRAHCVYMRLLCWLQKALAEEVWKSNFRQYGQMAKQRWEELEKIREEKRRDQKRREEKKQEARKSEKRREEARKSEKRREEARKSEKRREEKKQENQRRERVRRKKIQAREKAEKSRITVFCQCFGATKGRKVSKSRLAEAAGAEPSGEMR